MLIEENDTGYYYDVGPYMYPELEPLPEAPADIYSRADLTPWTAPAPAPEQPTYKVTVLEKLAADIPWWLWLLLAYGAYQVVKPKKRSE